ncbi:MAG: alpha/beta hydrolase [Gemmatimonadota bacterium]|nr:alpha/beta hydrolase [Gemmatimonadota bacterium]
MRGLLAALVALGLATAAAAASAQDAAPTPDHTFSYREIDGQALHAHVFFPTGHDAGQPANGILLFHGGGWSAGSPEWTFTTGRRFADWGLVAIAVEYRLTDADVTPIDAFDDVCAALGWARRHASELGMTTRLAGYGVSAGGHLIALTATRGCPSGEAGPDALLFWSPALDVARDGWFRRQLRGRATAAAYSPAEHVGPSTPPTSLVHGAEDMLTPLAGARRYCERVRQTGTMCELNVYEGVGHLLTRNLANQESDFDPDPDARADGIERQRRFLVRLGFVTNR